MNKYLLSFLFLFICTTSYAMEPGIYVSGDTVTVNTGNNEINFVSIKDTNQTNYIISNTKIVIDNFTDWQNWNPGSVTINPDVSLYITDVNTVTNGEQVNHLSSQIYVKTLDPNRLYKSSLNTDLTISVFRETNYENVFNDSRGTFIENIRTDNQNDKMLLAMDGANDMREINSIMNSAYHFNPNILMKPVKTINRAYINDMFMNENGVGVDVNYILSNKINDFGGRIYLNSNYDDLYFGIGINLNSFSFRDDFNEFGGLLYGIDIHARQYLNKFWLDGLFGINRTNFNAKNIYVNDKTSDNPSGMSEYGRLNAGYDYTKINDFTFSPFIGLLLQHYNIMESSNTDINFNAGLNGKYSFVLDGIKYEYGANVSFDEKANLNAGIKIGFESVVDKAGAFIKFDTFKYDFDMNYKFSINAKIEF